MTLSVIGAGLVTCLLVYVAGRPVLDRRLQKNSFWLMAAAIFLLGLTVRLWVGFQDTGFLTDINTFKAWARSTNEVGFSRTYRENEFLDYPPGYLYVLVALEKIRLFFGIADTSALFTLMIKLPSILGDLFCAGVILRLGQKKLGARRGLFVAAAYLFCPAVLQNSAQWGQVDSFCLSILLVSVLLCEKKWYFPAAAVYGLSIICKPQMLVFVPLFIFVLLRDEKYPHLILCPLTAIAVILLVALPFTEGFDFLWLLQKYWSTMNGYDYYSVNAYNFWALIGKNWVAMPGAGMAAYVPNWIGPVAATVLCGVLVRRSKGRGVVYICPVVLMATTYMFTVKMHERYLYPVLLFLLLGYVFAKDRRLLYSFGLVSFAHYLNTNYVLYLYQNFGAHYNPNEALVKVFSALQLLAYGYMMYVVVQVYLRQGAKAEPVPVFQPVVQGRMKRRDVLVLGVIVAVYIPVAFWQLGDRKMAVTPWTPAEGEQVTLEAEGTVDTLCLIPGIAPDESHYRARTGTNVTLAVSADGENWTQFDDGGQLADSAVLAWEQHHLGTPFRYLRITALDSGVCINEVGLCTEGTEGYVSLSLVEGDGAALIDEQGTVPVYPGYKNSTYFDEIYHVRTAYEHILRLEPYEYTHPPLGKLIIALGIQLFGLNPFGWRFMGTLFGVLMLPVLYHLLKQLFGSTFLCGVGTLLFAFDFMHYTQTRIATIDTYAVFFILLMFDAMVAFVGMDLKETPLRRLLIPLALSGGFMGLGAAAKWTVAYGALGLAMLLFGKMIVACRNEHLLGRSWWPVGGKCLQLCLWCLLWFIAIPFGIYFVAFLPQTNLPHNTPWGSFLNYQTSMFRYHAELEASHFFASTWYEWPVVYKPMWYFVSSHTGEPGKVSSISAMGSPALWWPMIPGLLYGGWVMLRKKARAATVAVIGFLAVYLPWVFVPRISFIYHYFTAIPFLIIALLVAAKQLMQAQPLRRGISLPTGQVLTVGHGVVALFVAVNLVFFIVFFPVLSGKPVNNAYLEWLEWLPKWYFSG